MWRYLPLNPPATGAVVLVGCTVLVAATVRRGVGARRLCWALLGVTVMAILVLTIVGNGFDGQRSVNWHLGAGIRSALSNINQALGLVNVLGNIAFFIPLGWLVAALRRPASTRRFAGRVATGVAVGAAMSICIEGVQYFVGRAADVDDVVLNASGALVGAVIGAALSSSRKSRRI